MVVYKCDRCCKNFKQKIDYIRHLKRKYPCKKVIFETPTHEYFVCQNCNKEFIRKDSLNRHIKKYCKKLLGKNKKKIVCNYCNKIFSRSDSLNRHISKYCKVKKDQESHNEIIFQELMKDMDELKEYNKQLINENNILKQNRTIKANNSFNNTQNNITNNQQNIKLVAFGKEDMSFIVEEVSKKILNKGFMSVPVLTKYTHFNNNIPEYNNIYISNMRNNYIMVYDGEKWNLRNREIILDDLLNIKSDFLIEQFDQYKDELDESTLRKFGRFMNQQHEDFAINEIKKELKLILYNNRNIPLETKKKLGIEYDK